ncbi:hypothetical protein GHT09_010669 [Marmota monax]|uniref:Uncharacterized protein n=1 Tax=Marmota monax TaxID=9995 RepID=A0A834UQ86_MARMO|nr:hypothetical protein GHT09_010669 [Marmota monax]
MDRREDRGGPGGRKKWAGRQAESVASLEPAGEGIRSLRGASPPSQVPRPNPSMPVAHTNKGSMCLFPGGPGPGPSSLLPLPPPATPPIPPPSFLAGSVPAAAQEPPAALHTRTLRGSERTSEG